MKANPMLPEVAYAVLQRMSLQLIHVLNSNHVPPKDIQRHLQTMQQIAQELERTGQQSQQDAKAN